MKITSSICPALIILCQIGNYLECYYLGRLENSIWELIFSPFIVIPVVLISLLGIAGIFAFSLGLRKNRVWATTILLGCVTALALQFYVLPLPAAMMMYGIKNRVMETSSINDLRRFAQDVSRDLPKVDLSHGNTSGLSAREMEAYNKLKTTYPFLNWGLGPNDGPSIQAGEGTVYVFWGGGLIGHWGFAVTANGGSNIAPSGSEIITFRVSDDIYFEVSG